MTSHAEQKRIEDDEAEDATRREVAEATAYNMSKRPGARSAAVEGSSV